MKRICILLCVCSLLLAACGAPPAAADSPLTERDVLAAYDEAAAVYDWFDLASLPTSGEAVEVAGMAYRAVDREGLSTYGDLEAAVRAAFAPDLADAILENSVNYRDIGGKLFCAEGGRGSNLYLLDKTVTAEPVDETHWTVTLTFWADSWEWERPGATVGYSQAVLNYEKTEDGWRFADFCPSDGLDLDAETVFAFTYDDDAFASADFDSWSDLQLALYLLRADGAYAEGVGDLLTRHFLEDPEDWFSALSVFADSPWENAQIVTEAPARHVYSRFSQEEQVLFQELLSAYQPKNAAEQSLLEGLKTVRDTAAALAAEDASAQFSLAVGEQFLSLGGKEGAFPWGLDLEERSRICHEGMDGFYPHNEVDCGSLTVWYGVSPEDGSESVFRLTASHPGASTPGGIAVGDPEAAVQAAYPEAVPLEAVGEWQVGADYALIYEPGGMAFSKHIAFFITDGVVTAIEIEDLMDGRLLS